MLPAFIFIASWLRRTLQLQNFYDQEVIRKQLFQSCYTCLNYWVAKVANVMTKINDCCWYEILGNIEENSSVQESDKTKA
jgi:hypothetical protein